jgi:protein-S-isoprenylcysteine O-methyltransferase Ste14
MDDESGSDKEGIADTGTGPEPPSRSRLLALLATRLGVGLPIMGLVLFLPAGSLAWWNAWIFLGVILPYMVLAMGWMLRHDPALLAKRLQTKEKRPTQKWYVIASAVLMTAAFVLPGLDFRFGWSRLPLWLVLAATAVMLAGFGLFFLVMRANSYASRVIEIQAGQKLIDSGPYRVVRHPMYAATVVIYLSLPIVLGSLPALAAFAAFLALLPVRILNEEKMLLAGLPGYADYMARVRWRIIPFLW